MITQRIEEGALPPQSSMPPSLPPSFFPHCLAILFGFGMNDRGRMGERWLINLRRTRTQSIALTGKWSSIALISYGILLGVDPLTGAGLG